MRMHCLSVASAPQVSESSARKQATRGFLQMINGRQYAPVRGTFINGIVVQAFLRGPLARGLGQLLRRRQRCLPAGRPTKPRQAVAGEALAPERHAEYPRFLVEGGACSFDNFELLLQSFFVNCEA